MLEKILAAIAKLDHTNPSHWIADGSPKLEAVRLFAGDQSITREDVAAAAPDAKRKTGDSDAPAGTVQPSVVSTSETEQGKPLTGADAVAAAQQRVADAAKRKTEADQEYAAAVRAVDALIENNALPAESFAEQHAQYREAQMAKLEDRKKRIDALRGVPLKDLLPTATPLDISFRRKTGFGMKRPGT
jgi:hypothetical protein